MTDYLEQALEGTADALLREQQRLERLLRSGGGSWMLAEEPAGDALRENVAPQAEKPRLEGWKSPVLLGEKDMETPDEQPFRRLEVELSQEATTQESQTADGPMQWRRAEDWQENGSEGARLFRRLEETVSPLEWTQDEERSLPLQQQIVRTGQILDAAQRLSVEWSGSLMRKRGSLSGEVGLNRRRGWTSELPMEPDGQRLGGISFSADGTQRNWAQQVDREFRRDSRRYDNGFFLY